MMISDTSGGASTSLNLENIRTFSLGMDSPSVAASSSSVNPQKNMNKKVGISTYAYWNLGSQVPNSGDNLTLLNLTYLSLIYS